MWKSKIWWRIKWRRETLPRTHSITTLPSFRLYCFPCYSLKEWSPGKEQNLVRKPEELRTALSLSSGEIPFLLFRNLSSSLQRCGSRRALKLGKDPSWTKVLIPWPVLGSGMHTGPKQVNHNLSPFPPRTIYPDRACPLPDSQVRGEPRALAAVL